MNLTNTFTFPCVHLVARAMAPLGAGGPGEGSNTALCAVRQCGVIVQSAVRGDAL